MHAFRSLVAQPTAKGIMSLRHLRCQALAAGKPPGRSTRGWRRCPRVTDTGRISWQAKSKLKLHYGTARYSNSALGQLGFEFTELFISQKSRAALPPILPTITRRSFSSSWRFRANEITMNYCSISLLMISSAWASSQSAWSRGGYGKLTFKPDCSSYSFAYGDVTLPSVPFSNSTLTSCKQSSGSSSLGNFDGPYPNIHLHNTGFTALSLHIPVCLPRADAFLWG